MKMKSLRNFRIAGTAKQGREQKKEKLLELQKQKPPFSSAPICFILFRIFCGSL
ncbi:unnamed protein product [Arabidopsis halleri]